MNLMCTHVLKSTICIGERQPGTDTGNIIVTARYAGNAPGAVNVSEPAQPEGW